MEMAPAAGACDTPSRRLVAPVFFACGGLYPLAFLVVVLAIGKLGIVRKVE